MPRKKKYTIPIHLIELESDNYHILVETSFSDQEKKFWAIDTGASKTVFDSNQSAYFVLDKVQNIEVESAGIGDERIVTQTGAISCLSFGELSIPHFDVALIDMNPINKLYEKFAGYQIVGLIGSDFLVKQQANIDYKKLTLTLFC